MNSKALGRQLMVEYYGCSSKLLSDKEHIRKVMLKAAIATGATIVADTFHTFKPHGVSGVVVIAESHLAIHTWPEYRYAAADIFTCGDEVEPDNAIDLLRNELSAERIDVREFERGLLTSFSGDPQQESFKNAVQP